MKILALKNSKIKKSKDIVSLAKKGEKEAFISLIQQNKINLYRVAKAMLHNEADIEDALQITILKAYENIKSLRKNNYFKTWLIRILINECNSLLKEKKKIIALDSLSDFQVASEDTYTNIDLFNAVYTLKEELRVVTVLFYYEDLSTKEISKLLKIPEGTVRSRLSNARGLLKKIFKIDESEGGL
ncbi:sigma-70 family RNA polymerase sigma factor [Bacillus sp. 03113]|uniref:sigma-70 family RNA polymerase sigma factor n=1 Tax=Bacillus sp. 03113 TaxID=2578211 RepID=UPI0011411424|nr:sigma-70 family RNA polymerase sigma factor [Bacillus sp. 03113]